MQTFWIGSSREAWVISRESTQYFGRSKKLSANNHMQRPDNHKVLGRGRGAALLNQVGCARVLTGQRAGADVGR
jgi:hypothetical protein